MGQDEGPHVGDWVLIAQLSWHRDYGIHNAIGSIQSDYWELYYKDKSEVSREEKWPFKAIAPYRGEPSDPSYEWFAHLHPYDRYVRVRSELEDSHFGASYLTLDEMRAVRERYVWSTDKWYTEYRAKEPDNDSYKITKYESLNDIDMAILIMEKAEQEGQPTRICFCYDN